MYKMASPDATAKRNNIAALTISIIVLTAILAPGCARAGANAPKGTVPHSPSWGIYALDLATKGVALLYSTANQIYSSTLRLNNRGDRLVFAQRLDGDTDDAMEICTIATDGTGFQRVTNNRFQDLYPAWSPDGTRLAFISLRPPKDLDIYMINVDGTGEHLLYDSGSHDADIDWAGSKIVFTSQFGIWSIGDKGESPTRITSPPDAGRWGIANLPIGDYDPRWSPDGSRIVFDRLEDPSSRHGHYNLLVVNADGSGETRLTNTGYAQGLASWSHSGAKIVYVVAAIGDEGRYHLYMVNADGTGNHDITPDYFPTDFLCHAPVFSKDDSRVYLIGQWWE